MINNDIDLVQRALMFSNLREINNAREVEAIFETHQYIKRVLPIWRKVDDPKDIASFVDLQKDLRSWLYIIRHDSLAEQRKIRMEIAKRFQEKSAETASINFQTLDGQPGSIEFRMFGVPTIEARIEAPPSTSG